MPICASTFNRRVEICEMVKSAPNALNERVLIAQPIAPPIWAGVNNRAAQERTGAGRTEGSVADVFTVRYSALTASISARHVIRYNGRVYDLKPPVEVGYREAFDILGEARADNAGA